VSTTIRTARPDDHDWIVAVVDEWWGRAVSAGVPRLFLDHFNSTSFVVEVDRKPVGFLIGFVSPSAPNVAYIHFVGVDPDHRSMSFGRQLYHRFFELARTHGCTQVSAITNAVNEASILFHRRMGFEVSDPMDGYDRPGVAHVRFTRRI
jgi:ribosomal protein S18 acetylase RimI-like enzyme